MDVFMFTIPDSVTGKLQTPYPAEMTTYWSESTLAS